MSDRQTWIEARRKGLGSTDAPAILGLSPYRSARDVYLDKLGLEAERPVSAPMEWGLRLEEAIAAAWAERTAGTARRVPMRRARHIRTFPMLASIDRIGSVGGSPVIVELKTARSTDGFVKEADQADVRPEDRIPPAYYVQVQHQMEVVGIDFADVAVLFGGSDFRVYGIPRDRDFGADLVSELETFWRENVEKRVEPPVGPDDGPMLARRFPRSTEIEKVATSEMILIVSELMGLEMMLERYGRERDLLENRVKDYLGPAGKMTAGDAVVSWKSYDRTTVGWKEVAAAYRKALLELMRTITAEGGAGIAYTPAYEAAGHAIETVEDLYSRTSPVRPFKVDRKKEG